MSEGGAAFTCPNCRRERPVDERGPDGWCSACRGQVVRRATLWARLVAAAVVLLAGLLLAGVIAATPRFLVGWLVLLGAGYFLVYKISQRVAFELVRSRGVPPPPESHG